MQVGQTKFKLLLLLILIQHIHLIKYINIKTSIPPTYTNSFQLQNTDPHINQNMDALSHTLTTQQKSPPFFTKFHVQSKLQALIDALTLSNKVKWWEIQGWPTSSNQKIKEFIQQKGEEYIENNFRELKCRQSEKLMICASLLESLYMTLSSQTHEYTLTKSSFRQTKKEQISKQSKQQDKILQSSDLQGYILLYLAILINSKDRTCAQTYLKLWSQKAKSFLPATINQFYAFIGNMNYVFSQWKDDVEFLEIYLKTIQDLWQKLLKNHPDTLQQEKRANIQNNIIKLQQVVRKMSYSFIKDHETTNLQSKQPVEDIQVLVNTQPISILDENQELSSIYFFCWLLIVMSTQQPYFIYKIRDKIFREEAMTFKETDFDISDWILNYKIIGEIILNKSATTLDEFKPMISIQITKSGVSSFPSAPKPEKKPQTNLSKQEDECTYIILDPVIKVCGILQQKFFIFLGNSKLYQQIFEYQLRKAIQELIFLQRVEDMKKLAGQLRQIVELYPQADIYIFDIAGQFVPDYLTSFVLNQEFEAVISIYSTSKTVRKYENKLKYSNLDEWSKLTQQIRKIKAQQTRKKVVSNFTVVTGRQKSMINKFQFNMKWMNQSCIRKNDRRKAKKDFEQFMNQWLNWSTYQRGKDVDQFFDILNKYQESYQNEEECSKLLLNLYTRQNFFYVILNKSLRGFTNPKHVGFLRYAFSGIFRAIQFSSNQEMSPKSQLTCYRGAGLNKKMGQALLNQLGDLKQEYIQMEGFMSTSQIKKVAEGFGSPLLQIQIYPHKNNNYANGFALLKNYSQFKNEEQILFNSRNYFKVKHVDKTKKLIKLEYCHMDIPEACIKDDAYFSKFKEMLDYNKFINDMKISTQGDVFLSLGDYVNARIFYELQMLEFALFQLRSLLLTDEVVNTKLSDLKKQLKISENLWQYIDKQWQVFISHEAFLRKHTNNLCQNIKELFYLLFLWLIKMQIEKYTGYFFAMTLKFSSMKVAKRGYSYSQIAKYIIEKNYKKNLQNSCIQEANRFKLLLGSFNVLIGSLVFYECSYEEMLTYFNNEETKYYWEKSKGTLEEAKLLRCLATCVMAHKQHQNALHLTEKYFFKCFQILKKIGLQVSLEYFQTKYNLANLYINYGLYDKVLQPLEEAIKICQKSFGIHHAHNFLNLKCMVIFAFTVGDFWKFKINFEKIKAKNSADLNLGLPITQNNCSLFLGQTTILISISKFREAESILQQILPPIRKILADETFRYILYKVFLNHLYYCKFMLNKKEQFEKIKVELNRIENQDFQLNQQIILINLAICYASNSFKTMKQLSQQMITLMRSYYHERSFHLAVAHAYLGLSLANLDPQNKQQVFECFRICSQYFSTTLMENSAYRYKALIVMAEGYLKYGEVKLACEYLMSAESLLKKFGFQNTYEHYRMHKIYQQILRIQERNQQYEKINELNFKIHQEIFGNSNTARIVQNNPSMEVDVAKTYVRKWKQASSFSEFLSNL